MTGDESFPMVNIVFKNTTGPLFLNDIIIKPKKRKINN
jgi:hypothetical protein